MRFAVVVTLVTVGWVVGPVCPCSIFGGPHVHQLRPDCGEIYDCNEIAFIVCVGVEDITNLACGCSSWLNRVVYYP